MRKISKKTDFTTWLIQSIAKVISTLFIAFILLTGIGSAISEPLTLDSKIIYAFILATLVGVVIAWFLEGISGLMLTIVGLVAIVVFMLTMPPRDYWVTLVIGASFMVSGILYLICWRRLNKSKISQDSALQDSSTSS